MNKPAELMVAHPELCRANPSEAARELPAPVGSTSSTRCAATSRRFSDRSPNVSRSLR